MFKTLFNSLQEIGISTKWIKIFCWILFGVLLLSLCLFVYDFAGKSKFATDITLWGYFGDFWWNLVTALASILNLVAFITITIMVAQMQKKQSENTSKTEILLATTQIKMDCVMELQKNLVNIISVCLDKDINTRKQNLSVIHALLLSFKNAYISVFFSNTGTSEIDELIKIIAEIKNTDENINNKINTFIEKRDILLKVLLQEIQQKVQQKVQNNGEE
jgi:uncharacterized membrane protein